MSKLLVNGDWFDSLSHGQYETDFEALVKSRANQLFPEHYTAPFRALVETESDAKIPDLALIEKSYRSWWVVEVEMAHHSLRGHVLPQVEVFANGKYGIEHARYLVEKCSELRIDRLLEMIKGAQPRVMVIVDQNCPAWIEPLRHHDAILAVVEIFRSRNNEHILRINGESPASFPGHLITTCQLDPLLPRLLRLDSTAALSNQGGARISILYSGGLTEWQRIDARDNVWLCPVGRNPLSPNRIYQINVDDQQQLYFQNED